MILKLEKSDISKEYSYSIDFMPFIILEKSSYYESQIKNTTTLPKGKKKEQIERNTSYRNIIKEEIILLDDDEVKQYLIKNYNFKFKEINSIYPKILNCDYYINNLKFEVENNE